MNPRQQRLIRNILMVVVVLVLGGVVWAGIARASNSGGNAPDSQNNPPELDQPADNPPELDQPADSPPDQSTGENNEIAGNLADGVFSYADASLVALRETCEYVAPGVFTARAHTQPGTSGTEVLSITGDNVPGEWTNGPFYIWSVGDLLAAARARAQLDGVNFDVENAFFIGDGTDFAVTTALTIIDDVATVTGPAYYGNHGNTFAIDPASIGYVILKDAAIYVVDGDDVTGFLHLRVRHLLCRDKNRPVQVIGDLPLSFTADEPSLVSIEEHVLR